MNVFRAYILDSDGKIAAPPKVLECRSDEEAIELAKPMVDGQDIEVWQGDRRITVLKHTEY